MAFLQKILKKISGVYTTILLLFAAQFSVYSQSCNVQDSLELVAFYNSTNGASWTNPWVLSQKVTTWSGVDLHTTGVNIGRVDRLTFNNRNIIGQIRNFNLPYLTDLGIYSNANITGPIPNFSSISNLKNLWVTNNPVLTGPIPSFSNLSNLTILFIQSNTNITGSIPNFSNLSNLKDLYLNNNNFSSTIPNITFTSSNYYFGIKDNQFNFGDIQNAWTALNNGATFNDYAPQKTILPLTQSNGILTADLAGANLSDLTYKWYKNGTLVATIAGTNKYVPYQAGTYTYTVSHATITQPSIANKNLVLNSASVVITTPVITHPIPAGLAACLYDDFIELDKLYNATNGDNWINKTNWLTSADMENWYGVELTTNGCDVKVIGLGGNQLVGSLVLLNLPQLIDLTLSGNNGIGGNIPNFSLSNLKKLYVDGCNLNGTIPNFNAMPKLEVFFAWFNHFSGVIPNFDYLPELIDIRLVSNNLNGWISNFSNCTKLKIIALGQNPSLQGPIPDFNLPLLEHFSADYCNNLLGNIPKFTYLHNLKTLELQGSYQLSGCIPSELKVNCPLIGANGGKISGCTNLTTQDWASYWSNNAGACATSISMTGVACNTAQPAALKANDNYASPQYLWSNGANTQTINITSPGLYTVTVTQGWSYNQVATFNVIAPAINATATTTTATCAQKGTITLSTTAGTIQSYTYIGTGTNSASGSNNGSVISNIPAGIYTVQATLTNGCTSTPLTVTVDHANRIALASWYTQSNQIAAWNQSVNWGGSNLSDPRMSGWTGITVDPNMGCVTSIDLPYKNINGNSPVMAGMDSLKTIILTGNALSGTLDMNYGNLKKAYLGQNKFSSVATLNTPKCTEFVIDYNNISNPTATMTMANQNLPEMQYFSLHNSKLTTMGTFVAPKLQQLSLNNNLLATLPTLNFPLLTTLNLQNNNLTSLPSITTYPNYSPVNVSNNKLDFSDFLNWSQLSTSNSNNNNYLYVTYAPQQDFIKTNFYNYKLWANPGGNQNQTTYKWFCNGILTATTADSSYVPLVSGSWTCQMTHAGITQPTTYYNKNLVLNSLAKTVSACNFNDTDVSAPSATTYNYAGTAGVAPASKTFTVTPPSGTNFTYQWYDENWVLQTTPNPLNPTFGFSAKGNNYERNLVVTMGANCQDTIYRPFEILCVVGLNAQANNSTPCAGSTISLSATPSSGVPPFAYAWFAVPANTAFSGNQNTTATSTTANTVIYKAVIEDQLAGCSAEKLVTVTYKPVPIASAGPDVTVNCAAPTATLTASGGGTYLWSNGLGNTASVSATPSATTTYIVTVTGANACTATDDVKVTTDIVPPVANAGVDVTVNCTTPSTTLTASGGGTYAWSNGLGNTASVSATPSVTTTYTVTVTGSNACTATDNVLVTVDNFVPVISTSGIGTITCVSNVNGIVLSASVPTPYVPTNYSWTGGLNNNTLVKPLVTTTYTVTVTMANGCKGTATQTVVIDNTPPSATISASATALNCATASATLSVLAQTGATYAWTIANSSTVISTQNSISVSPTAATTYNVVVTGANGCTATASQAITVNKIKPLVGISQPNVLTCTNPSATLTASAILNGGGTASYKWSTLATTPSIVVAPTIAQTYNVTVTDSGNSCTASKSVDVFVNQTPPVMTVNASNLTVNCTNTSTTLSTTFISGLPIWSANPSSTTVYDWGTNYAYSYPNVNTVYTVSVTNPSNGCISVGSVSVTVDKQKPTANAGPDLTIDCNNSSALLDLSASSGSGGSPVFYKWTLVNDPWNAISTNAMYSVTPSITTNYLGFVMNLNNGCLSDADPVTVFVVDKPTVNAGNDLFISCYTGQAVTLTATYNPNISTIQWYKKGSPSLILSTSATLSIPSHSQNTETYVAKVISNSGNGCFNEDEVIVNANFQLPNVVQPAGHDKVTCTGVSSPIQLGITPLSWPTWTYNWSNGSTLAQPTVYVSVTTDFYVTVTNPNTGCSIKDTVNVLVNPATLASISVTSGTTSACAGTALNVVFTCTATGTAPFSYQWFRLTYGGQAVSVATGSNVYTATSGGKYYCMVSSSCGVKKSNTLELSQPPKSKIVAIGTGGSTIYCANKLLKVVPSGNLTPISYEWQYQASILSGWLPVGTNDDTLLPGVVGRFKCIVTYSANCFDEDNEIVITQTNCFSSGPLVNKVKGDINDLKNVENANVVKEIKSEEGLSQNIVLQVSPNPAQERAMLKFVLPNAGHVKLTLTDASAMTRIAILDGDYEAGEHFTILDQSIHNLVDGIYFVTIQVGKEIKTQKLVILNR